MSFDADVFVESLGDELADLIRDCVSRATAPLVAKVAALELRLCNAPGASLVDKVAELEQQLAAIPAGPMGPPGPPGPAGENGSAVNTEAMLEFIKGSFSDSLRGEKGDSGKDAPSMEEIIANVLPLIAKPKDGQPGKDGTNFVAGEGPPLFTGGIGDVYLDAKTGDVYRCA